MHRGFIAALLSGGFALAGHLLQAQDAVPPKKIPHRFGYFAVEEIYPQKTPKETMQSIVRVLGRKKTDYLLAQLVDPAYVDYWVDHYKEKEGSAQAGERAKILLAFDRLVRDTDQYYSQNPQLLRELRLFAVSGEWEEKEDSAVGTVKSLPTRKVFLRRIDQRWFLENRQQDPAAAK